MQRIRVLLLTATSPLLESVTSCCLMLWPNMPSGSSWRRENQSSMEAMGSVLFGCCFCCFLTISWGSQHLSVTCVSLTFVPISTYYHQTSVIYFYGFVHEMKLNWAVVSSHSLLDLTFLGIVPAAEGTCVDAKWPMHTFVVNEGPCFIGELNKVYRTAPWPFFLSHHSRDQFLGSFWGYILQMSQSAWLNPGSIDQHTRFRRHAVGKLGLWGETFVIKLTPEMEAFSSRILK